MKKLLVLSVFLLITSCGGKSGIELQGAIDLEDYRCRAKFTLTNHTSKPLDEFKAIIKVNDDDEIYFKLWTYESGSGYKAIKSKEKYTLRQPWIEGENGEGRKNCDKLKKLSELTYKVKSIKKCKQDGIYEDECKKSVFITSTKKK